MGGQASEFQEPEGSKMPDGADVAAQRQQEEEERAGEGIVASLTTAY